MKKKKVVLNGRHYRFGDLYDSWNIHQQKYFDGTCDDIIYKPIPQDNGEPLPPLATQWKEDMQRRLNVKSSRNR